MYVLAIKPAITSAIRVAAFPKNLPNDVVKFSLLRSHEVNDERVVEEPRRCAYQRLFEGSSFVSSTNKYRLLKRRRKKFVIFVLRTVHLRCTRIKLYERILKFTFSEKFVPHHARPGAHADDLLNARGYDYPLW